MESPAPKTQLDADYADILGADDHPAEPVEMHPDCEDIFAVEERPCEPVDPDVADIVENGDPAPSVER